MAISLYSGTPGSGKSLDVARIILMKLKMGKTVIGTMRMNNDMLKKYKGKYIFCDIYSLNPGDLVAYARKYNKKGIEKQTYLVIDECQFVFNSREWQSSNRKKWNEFFTTHRHFGYEILLITQYDRLIDRQLRALIEYEYIHRKISNIGIKGKLLSLLAGGKLFITVSYYYPLKERLGADYFVYKSKFGKLYDSYACFNEDEEMQNELLPFLQEETKHAPDIVGDDGDPDGVCA